MATKNNLVMKKRNPLFNMTVSEEDKQVISELQQDFAVNVSQFFRLAIRQHLKELKEVKKAK